MHVAELTAVLRVHGGTRNDLASQSIDLISDLIAPGECNARFKEAGSDMRRCNKLIYVIILGFILNYPFIICFGL